MPQVYIVDTTLRDGEQAPGIAFTTKEKIEIARYLDQLGIPQIEAGVPAMGEVEEEAIKAIMQLGLKARVNTWNRLLLADIRASLHCGVRNLHISAPVSDIHIKYKLNKSRLWVLDCLKRALRYALDYGCWVSVGAEDASRADPNFLLEFALLAQEMGANRLRYADTIGMLDPFTTYKYMSFLKSKVNIELEFHGHNDFGMATANALAAVKAGVQYIDVTVAGLGERAGNTDFEELTTALEQIYGINPGFAAEKMKILSCYVKRAANRRSTCNSNSNRNDTHNTKQYFQSSHSLITVKNAI